MNVAVTTSRRPTSVNIRRAKGYARALGVPFVPREGRSLVDTVQIGAKHHSDPLVGALVVGEELTVWTPEGALFYHPGMALHRVAALRRGESDTMVEALRLRPGDEVLDCTAGLASDAVVSSHVVGPTGRVVALESVGVLALLLKVGLRCYPGQGPALTAAMRRVRVRHCEYTRYLSSCAPKSFDVVYFDPMFAQPVEESKDMAPLRPLADHSPLTETALRLACRVARRLVGVKDRRHGPLHTGCEWDDIGGGKKSRVVYLVRYVDR